MSLLEFSVLSPRVSLSLLEFLALSPRVSLSLLEFLALSPRVSLSLLEFSVLSLQKFSVLNLREFSVLCFLEFPALSLLRVFFIFLVSSHQDFGILLDRGLAQTSINTFLAEKNGDTSFNVVAKYTSKK